MKFLSLLGMTAFAMTVASQVQARQLGPVPDGCFKDLSGKISCRPMGGEIHVTSQDKPYVARDAACVTRSAR
jgi:hypothetical protein